jgi:hypothetical protein
MLSDIDLLATYTRRVALEEGVLVDVTEAAKRAGFQWPVVMSKGVWMECVEVPKGLFWQSEDGRIRDILRRLMHAVLRSLKPIRTITFQVLVQKPKGAPELLTLRADSWPDDEGNHSLVVMLPDEEPEEI